MDDKLPDRIYRRDPLPGMDDLRDFIGTPGAQEAFDGLLGFMAGNYDYEPEICFGGKRFGVLIRWRRSGRTLLSVFPEQGGFSVVLIYGQQEIDRFSAVAAAFDPYLAGIFEEAHRYHDGKWMLIRLEDSSLLPQLEEMIRLKKRPGKK